MECEPGVKHTTCREVDHSSTTKQHIKYLNIFLISGYTIFKLENDDSNKQDTGNDNNITAWFQIHHFQPWTELTVASMFHYCDFYTDLYDVLMWSVK